MYWLEGATSEQLELGDETAVVAAGTPVAVTAGVAPEPTAGVDTGAAVGSCGLGTAELLKGMEGEV